MTGFGDIRSLAQARPSEDAWALLCDALEKLEDAGDDSEFSESLLPYVLAHLSRWPDALRRPRHEWLEALQRDHVTPLWSLVRQLGRLGFLWTMDLWERLWASECAPCLTAVDLKGAQLGPEALEVWSDAGRTRSLRRLTWSGALYGLGWLDIERFPALEHLDLYGAGLRTNQLEVWSQQRWDALCVVSLEYNQLTRLPWPEGVLGRLERLHLQHNPLTGESLAVLAQGSRRLRVLDVSETHVGDEGMRHLGTSEALASLRTLDARSSSVTDVGVRALLEGTLLSHLERLTLSRNQISDASALEIARSPAATNLKTLDLRGTQITEFGWRALAQSEFLEEGLRTSFRAMFP